MKSLLLYVFLASLSCLLTIYLFSQTLSQSPSTSLSRSHRHSHQESSPSSSSSMTTSPSASPSAPSGLTPTLTSNQTKPTPSYHSLVERVRNLRKGEITTIFVAFVGNPVFIGSLAGFLMTYFGGVGWEDVVRGFGTG